jgi:hypothetical protein
MWHNRDPEDRSLSGLIQMWFAGVHSDVAAAMRRQKPASRTRHSLDGGRGLAAPPPDLVDLRTFAPFAVWAKVLLMTNFAPCEIACAHFKRFGCIVGLRTIRKTRHCMRRARALLHTAVSCGL